MTKEERIKAIELSKKTGEIKSITYKDTTDNFDVKSIDLSNLLYNPYNGRIRSSVLSHESRTKKVLDPNSNEDKLIIEQYLYDSASHRNEKTIESIEEKGQQEIGIVTKDGVIIDGNRRALLLSIINKKNNTNIPFKAIVLPDELENNRKEITLLETGYQMGVDSKVEYNPIEKYLRCYELNTDYGMSFEQISSIMAEETKRIEEWINIFNLMSRYLDYLKTPQLYTRLEKREGHFVDLNSYLKAYYGKQNHTVKWAYTDTDVQKLENCYFDYIRLGIPVQSARIIAKSSSSNSFFCQKNIWPEFISDHDKIISGYKEVDFNTIKESEKEKSNEDIVRWLDNKWKSEIGEKLTESLSYNESILKDLFESHAPIKILKRVVNNLGQIDAEKLKESDRNEVDRLLKAITEKLDSFKDLLSN